jgi:hypothetical protein
MKEKEIANTNTLFTRLKYLDAICCRYFRDECDAELAYTERDHIVSQLQLRYKDNLTHSIHNL